jgi:hypothetical protein
MAAYRDELHCFLVRHRASERCRSELAHAVPGGHGGERGTQYFTSGN